MLVTPMEEDFTVSCIIDSHMHIQSGNTAPVPLLRKKSIVLRTPFTNDRTEMEETFAGALMNEVLGGLGDLQSLSSDAIAECALRRNNATFATDSTIGRDRIYTGELMPHESHPADASSTALPSTEPGKLLYTPMIVLTMDMEYAHLSGFEGKTIYHTDERGNKFFYQRKDAFHREEDGRRKNLEVEEKNRFQEWNQQIRETKEAVRNHPWDLLPLYHYEPRRWNYPQHYEVSGNLTKGSWDYPFTEVASGAAPGRGGVFLGFKMYPRLGYMPLDDRCKYLPRFYDKCVSEDIPIMTHCSPGGMTTHDEKFYVDADGMGSIESSDSPDAPADATTVARRPDPHEYFDLKYGHPQSWRKVLRGRENLRLCLAHFGGELWKKGPDDFWIQEVIDLIRSYENVYTDISCWNIVQNAPAFKEFLRNPAFNEASDNRRTLWLLSWQQDASGSRILGILTDTTSIFNTFKSSRLSNLEFSPDGKWLLVMDEKGQNKSYWDRSHRYFAFAVDTVWPYLSSEPVHLQYPPGQYPITSTAWVSNPTGFVAAAGDRLYKCELEGLHEKLVEEYRTVEAERSGRSSER